MVVEHTFVTTLSERDTMMAAMQLLGSRGFQQRGQGFAIDGKWDTLEMRRGVKKARKAKSIAKLPQVVHVSFDRGRVAVALSIEASYRWGGSRAFISFGITVDNVVEKPKKMKLHQSLLLAIATSLERLLAERQSPESAVHDWDEVEREIAVAARRRRNRSIILASITVLLIGGAIALVVWAASRSR